MVVMAISDVMTLNFFYMVRDEGSWLDIGMTISHFCIASFLCVFVAGLEFLSEAFISGLDFGIQDSAGHADGHPVDASSSSDQKSGHDGKVGGKRSFAKSGVAVEVPVANGSAPASSTTVGDGPKRAVVAN